MNIKKVEISELIEHKVYLFVHSNKIYLGALSGQHYLVDRYGYEFSIYEITEIYELNRV